MKESLFTHSDVIILNNELVYDGFFKVRRFDLRFPLFMGGMSQVVMREMVERRAAVAVLPYDPVRRQVVLVEQFRIGALNVGDSPWVLEIIAGLIDHAAETPAAVAHREAKEEAGLMLQDLRLIYHYFPSPGASSESLYLYYARVDATQAQRYSGLHEENEDIRVHVLAEDQAMGYLDAGKINNAATIIALQWLKIHRETLKA